MEGYKSGKQRRAEIKAARRLHRLAARGAAPRPYRAGGLQQADGQ